MTARLTVAYGTTIALAADIAVGGKGLPPKLTPRTGIGARQKDQTKIHFSG
jgi:hypothetical protein